MGVLLVAACRRQPEHGRFICWAAFHLRLSAARISLNSGCWTAPSTLAAMPEELRFLAFLTSLVMLFMSESLLWFSAWIELPA